MRKPPAGPHALRTHLSFVLIPDTRCLRRHSRQVAPAGARTRSNDSIRSDHALACRSAERNGSDAHSDVNARALGSPWHPAVHHTVADARPVGFAPEVHVAVSDPGPSTRVAVRTDPREGARWPVESDTGPRPAVTGAVSHHPPDRPDKGICDPTGTYDPVCSVRGEGPVLTIQRGGKS